MKSPLPAAAGLVIFGVLKTMKTLGFAIMELKMIPNPRKAEPHNLMSKLLEFRTEY